MKILRELPGTLAAMSLMSTLTAGAPDVASSKAKLEARITAMQDRLERLEKMFKMVKEIRADAARRSAAPAWLGNLKFSGDLRLRYQGESFEAHGKKNRQRLRFRLRLGFEKSWLNGQMLVKFRLASGEPWHYQKCKSPTSDFSDATSTNQTLGRFFSEKPVWIDLAYTQYKPIWMKGLRVVAGKMKNPMVHTDLVWDSDVNPEGVWTSYARKFEKLEPFAGVGYFVVDESSGGFDVDLWVYQLGLNWKIFKGLTYTIAGTYYDYDHLETANIHGNGNHLSAPADFVYLAGKFQMINLTNRVKWNMFGLPMVAYFDWVHNCGNEDNSRNYSRQSDGYAVAIEVGANNKQGDWSAGYKYAYIEANAVPDTFNDADFGHVNRKGHVWTVKYNVTDSMIIGGKILYTGPVTASRGDSHAVTVQGDLFWRF